MNEQEILDEEMKRAAIAELILSDGFLVFTQKGNKSNYYRAGGPEQYIQPIIVSMINNKQIAQTIEVALMNYHYEVVKQGLKSKDEEE